MPNPYRKIEVTNKPSSDTTVIFGWNKFLYIELMKGKKFEFVNIKPEPRKPRNFNPKRGRIAA